MPEHVVFYDGECGLCDRVVQRLLRWDKKKVLAFAPLQGKTAETHLVGLPNDLVSADSMILVERFKSTEQQVYVRGKAAFRIAWLMGGAWKLVAWPFFLPAWLYDWAYRLVATNRKWLLPQTQCFVPPGEDKQNRFLP